MTAKVQESQHFWTRWSAPLAFWGGITMGPSRTSMTFPSHGGAEGMMRRILGKWEVRWLVHEIRLLSYSHQLPITSNEVKSFTGVKPVMVDGRTTQRTTVYLVDVEYAMRASMVLTKYADPYEDDVRKFEEMFLRRASQGQFHGRKPCMGTSECPADYELFMPNETIPEAMNRTEDYGLVYYDRDWSVPEQPFYYAPLRCDKGIVVYPTWEEVRRLGILRSATDLKRAS